nr:microtubule-associated protein Jupiter isoform X7 [Aedes albopictus]
MTSTSFTIGFGDNSKSSSKVLKPPGGGSSDLFGADNQPQTPRSMNKNRMQSNIFAAPEGQKAGNGETPRRGASGQDSYNRLFGEADRPYTPAKNHMKSNLPIGNDATDAGKTNGHSSSSNGKANGHHQNGNGIAQATNGHSSHSNGSSHTNGHSNGTSTSSAPSQNGSTHKNGNPVTGEGYKSGGAAEINTTVPSLNGAGHVINKNRIPPGGFSSGLW